MKKTLFFVFFAFSATQSMGQWTTIGTNIHNSNTGNVGIGTTTPGAKLVVNGKARVLSHLMIGADEDPPPFMSLVLKSNPTIGLFDPGQPVDQRLWILINQGSKFRILTEKDDYSAIQEAFVITRTGLNVNTAYFPNGNVGIGTSNPGTFKLAVEGKIGAREVRVTNTNPWPDHVFKPAYSLLPLSATESFIRQYGHLPEVPSAEEIKKEGYDMSIMDATLLKKIEELTLHMIELDKKLAKLVEENEQLKKNQVKRSGK